MREEAHSVTGERLIVSAPAVMLGGDAVLMGDTRLMRNDVVHHRGTAVTLSLPHLTPFNVDGELLDAGREVTVTIDPDSIAVVVSPTAVA